MDTTRWERLAPLTGLGAVAAMVASALMFNFWEYLPDPGEFSRFLSDNSGLTLGAGYVGMIGAFLLLWFAGSVKTFLRPLDSDGRFSAIAFGGTVATAALLGLTYSIMIAGAARAGSDSGIGAAEAALTYDLYGTVVASGAAMGLAALILAFGFVAARRGTMPVWAVWLGGLLALGSLSPVSYVFVGLDMVWVAIVSVWMYRRAVTPAF